MLIGIGSENIVTVQPDILTLQKNHFFWHSVDFLSFILLPVLKLCI